MNPYTTMGQARIRRSDVTSIVHAHGLRAGQHLAALERQRGGWAEAELDWLLTQNRGAAGRTSSIVSALRQAIGAMLVHAGRSLSGGTLESGPPQTTPEDRFSNVRAGLRLGEAVPSR